jgi:hypothetical protein
VLEAHYVQLIVGSVTSGATNDPVIIRTPSGFE